MAFLRTTGFVLIKRVAIPAADLSFSKVPSRSTTNQGRNCDRLFCRCQFPRNPHVEDGRCFHIIPAAFLKRAFQVPRQMSRLFLGGSPNVSDLTLGAVGLA